MRTASIFRPSPVLLGITLLSFSVIFQSNHSRAAMIRKRTDTARLVPAPLLKWPEKGSPYAVLVDKSLQKVFVYHKDNLFEPVRTFNCSTGENNGPKSRRNDRKTPEALASFIQLGDTPVIISQEIEMIEADRLKTEATALELIVESWRAAWEDEEIETYMSFYNSHFNASGKDWDEWKAYKLRLADKYKNIHVKVHNLRLLRNDGLILAQFDQAY
jgi:murein L,D-transpeptidase YafK